MKKRDNIYVYPKLDSFIDIGIRVGGFGLANCMFVYARAIVLVEEKEYKLINPTWQRFGFGQYLRNEKDKRNYFGIFKKDGISGLKKYLLIFLAKKIKDVNNILMDSFIPQIIVVEGLGNYFEPLIPFQKQIKDRFHFINRVKIDNLGIKKSIGIHIRLGDFIDEYRTSLEWYVEKINQIKNLQNNQVEFLLFSDGTDEQLKSIIEIENVNRCFFGNAFADILAISECCLILGSDSTFSGWAAFLGQKPSIFNNKHYGRIMIDEKNEIILKYEEEIPREVKNYLNTILI